MCSCLVQETLSKPWYSPVFFFSKHSKVFLLQFRAPGHVEFTQCAGQGGDLISQVSKSNCQISESSLLNRPKTGRLWPMGQLLIFVNKVLLEHSFCSLTHCIRLLLPYSKQSWVIVTETVTKRVTIWTFKKKFANPQNTQ